MTHVEVDMPILRYDELRVTTSFIIYVFLLHVFTTTSSRSSV